MKSLLAIMVLFFSVVSEANTVQSVFQEKSPIPQDLKALILRSVVYECGSYFSEFELKEMNTETRVVKTDQLKDEYFKTIFSIRDGSTAIVVESASFEIKNPIFSRYEVFNIALSGGGNCDDR